MRTSSKNPFPFKLPSEYLTEKQKSIEPVQSPEKFRETKTKRKNGIIPILIGIVFLAYIVGRKTGTPPQKPTDSSYIDPASYSAVTDNDTVSSDTIISPSSSMYEETPLQENGTESKTITDAVDGNNDNEESDNIESHEVIRSNLNLDGPDCSRIINAGKIILLTNAEYEPFEYKTEDEIVGFDIDLAETIANRMGVELEVNDIAFESLIPSLESGKGDIILSGMIYTEERNKRVDFSQSYFDGSQVIIVPVNSLIGGPEDLNGKVLGVITGTLGDLYCSEFPDEYGMGDCEVKKYNQREDAFLELMVGSIDAIVVDAYIAENFIKENGEKFMTTERPLEEDKCCIATSEGSDLVTVINEVLDDLRKSGELDQMINNYFPV